MNHSPTSKYLANYAEEEARILLSSKGLDANHWQRVVVLPSYHEADLLPGALQSLAQICRITTERTLAIVVVNGKKNDTEELQKNSAASLKAVSAFAQSWERLNDSPPISLGKGDDFDLLLIDRASHEFSFPEKQGVGLARKLGCDTALALWSNGALKCDWIFTSDADVIFPEKYFAIGDVKAPAAICNYEHIPTDSSAPSWQALQLYEISLRYYEHGLKYAKSPYAFQTLGSTIAVRPEAYAMVRGFPKRLAGEDFYILNKLSKMGPIHTHKEANLLIRDRDSARVPFGTGTSVTKIKQKLILRESFSLYSPRSFLLLKLWLNEADEFMTHGSLVRLQRQFFAAAEAGGVDFNAEFFTHLDTELHLLDGISEVFTKSADPEIRKRHFHTWFDALKTLRFIHVCKNKLFPNERFDASLDQAEFIKLRTPACENNLFKTLGELRQDRYQ